MSWVFEHSTAHLAARLVLLAIANHSDRDGRNSWASVRQLSEEARCSERQVQYALRELESTGEITRVGVSPSRTHIYELPAMQTLFRGGADTAPAHPAPVQPLRPAESAGRKTRRARVQNPSKEGEHPAPEPRTNRPKGNHPSPASPEASNLCELLADLVEANGSKRPKVTRTWVTEAERIFRLDKRPPTEAERVLRWSQADEFWRSNILSIPTFRAKYDRLRLAAMRTTERRTLSVTDRLLAREGLSNG
jgi:hypothetical protein